MFIGRRRHKLTNQVHPEHMELCMSVFPSFFGISYSDLKISLIWKLLPDDLFIFNFFPMAKSVCWESNTSLYWRFFDAFGVSDAFCRI